MCKYPSRHSSYWDFFIRGVCGGHPMTVGERHSGIVLESFGESKSFNDDRSCVETWIHWYMSLSPRARRYLKSLL